MKKKMIAVGLTATIMASMLGGCGKDETASKDVGTSEPKQEETSSALSTVVSEGQDNVDNADKEEGIYPLKTMSHLDIGQLQISLLPVMQITRNPRFIKSCLKIPASILSGSFRRKALTIKLLITC